MVVETLISTNLIEFSQEFDDIMTFPKYIDGQQISAYTSNDKIFEGYVHTKEGIKYAVDDNGKSVRLSELQKVKRIGKLLKEEAEKDWEEQLQKFTDYYNNTFDTEKVSKANDNVKDKIIDEYIGSADDVNVSQHTDDFKKDAISRMNQAAAQDQIDKGNTTVDQEIEKLKKENNSDNELNESYFSNTDIQSAIIREDKENTKRVQENKLVDQAYDTCEEMAESGATEEEIVDYLVCDLGMELEDAKEMAACVSDSRVLTWENTKEPSKYEKISEEVDNEFEKALTELNSIDNLVTKHIVEILAEKFNADGKKALEETDNVPDAVLNLAEQVKQARLKIRR